MPRELISENAFERRYRVTNNVGAVVGEDVEQILTGAQLNEQAIRDRARLALDVNAAYLALGTTTAAQNTAQVKALTRQVSALIRLTLGALDSIEAD